MSIGIGMSSSLEVFNIKSFVAAAAWNNDLQLSMTGERSGVGVYTETIILQVKSATNVVLDWKEIDKITFTTSGGTPATSQGFATQFAMDNLCITTGSQEQQEPLYKCDYWGDPQLIQFPKSDGSIASSTWCQMAGPSILFQSSYVLINVVNSGSQRGDIITSFDMTLYSSDNNPLCTLTPFDVTNTPHSCGPDVSISKMGSELNVAYRKASFAIWIRYSSWSSGHYKFTLFTTLSHINANTTTGLCVDGCKRNRNAPQMIITESTTHKEVVTSAMADSICNTFIKQATQHLPLNESNVESTPGYLDAVRQACVIDVTVTGSTQFAEQSVSNVITDILIHRDEMDVEEINNVLQNITQITQQTTNEAEVIVETMIEESTIPCRPGIIGCNGGAKINGHLAALATSVFIVVFTHQIISYCLRSLDGNISNFELNYTNKYDISFTFTELQQQNITSQQLLSWSASIDLAERYEMFLNNITNSLFDNETLFYNCTLSSFGPFCRFTFDLEDEISFDEIVEFYFNRTDPITKDINTTCYIHLKCNTSMLCLDWREICDRKFDCLDGSDEINCWQLELNECTLDEYRCHNGQCIPKEFFHDISLNPDCLDQSDEGFPIDSSRCYSDPTFRCEEQTCRSGMEEFPCGDGQCVVGAYSLDQCKNGRGMFLLDDACSLSVACLISIRSQFCYEWCDTFCPDGDCVKDNCLSLHEFSYGPILAGYARFLIINKDLQTKSYTNFLPHYICYNETNFVDFRSAKEHLNNSNCRRFDPNELDVESMGQSFSFEVNLRNMFRAYFLGLSDIYHCNHSMMYQCNNSIKCISIHRLRDTIQDCPFNDDETFDGSCSLSDAYRRYACVVDGSKVCFSPLIIKNGIDDCTDGVDEREENVVLKHDYIYFQKICDGIEELLPIFIDGRYETDETECEHWLCNNTYTRCDQFWSCRNGADEVNCLPLTCANFEHPCIFPNDTSKISCLPITQAGNGIMDCLGGSDEPYHCHSLYPKQEEFRFACSDYSNCLAIIELCDNIGDCSFDDDEIFCTTYEGQTCTACDLWADNRTEVEDFFCDLFDLDERSEKETIYFILRNIPNYFLRLTMKVDFPKLPPIQTITSSIRRIPIFRTEMINVLYCNRGILFYNRMTDDTQELHCLCPPSYYGDTCQYQNQRVSLTIQIRATSDWQQLFTFIIILMDVEGNIESHDFIEYLAIRDCVTKFNIYLLYSSRPKNSSKIYSIRIDAYLKTKLTYRASWMFPLQFTFLPVHRLSTILTIPYSNIQPLDKCTPSCIHGQCFPYINNQSLTFCQCNSNWSGLQCMIEKKCDCAYGSLCIDSSICVCPLNRFGPRCYLISSSCHFNSCINDGQCVPIDERYKLLNQKKSTCICPFGYTGVNCEYQLNQTQIEISFDNDIPISSSLLIHFITVEPNALPIFRSVMKKIAFYESILVFSITFSFHISFAKIFNSYYLIILREEIITAANISTRILPSYRCASIYELFNSTLANQHLLKRIKYYHQPCQKRQELICFYDEIHFCLCDLDRQANCFEFNHNMTYDCYGYNFCENRGQCFQDDKKCPKSAICSCPECYYGSRCQFSTIGSTLSLDVILGYQIYPNMSISQQPIVIKITIILFVIMFCLGFLSNIFSLITFQRETTRNVGCGLYLFISSIISMIIMIIFTIKFWFLLIFQIGLINNRLFMFIQCVSIDFLLRLFLSFGDWLSACVAIERAVNVSKGIKFDKVKSKKIAKWIILFVFILTICSYIHDPNHRHLIDDDEEHRIWCMTKYSSSLQIFDWTMNLLHFLVPFLINFISALIIIINATRIRSNVHKKQSRKKILHKQFQQHKHLLITPIILILLAFPRLIISFLFGCMKSARNPWLYLTGYFISFIPSMMIFIVFVLPSRVYRDEFTQSIKRILDKII
ncbi:hypothetical protein I4U23_011177 [Adineta vaga]|nr:hypothetical protein I4U23_011177 [Adineta vaga]